MLVESLFLMKTPMFVSKVYTIDVDVDNQSFVGYLGKQWVFHIHVSLS